MKKLTLVWVMVGLLMGAAQAQKTNCNPTGIKTKTFSLSLSYDGGGLLSKVEDNSGNVYKVTRNGARAVERIDYYEDDEMIEWYIYKENVIEYWDEDGIYETFELAYDGTALTAIKSLNGSGEVEFTREFTWEGANVSEMKAYKPGEEPKVFTYAYDDKPNVQSQLQPFMVILTSKFNHAELLSANNLESMKLPNNESMKMKMEYNEQGCVLKLPQTKNSLTGREAVLITKSIMY